MDSGRESSVGCILHGARGCMYKCCSVLSQIGILHIQGMRMYCRYGVDIIHVWRMILFLFPVFYFFVRT